MNFLKTPDFEHRMTRGERFAAWGYLPIHLFILPILIGVYIALSESTLSEAEISLPYYMIGLAFCIICTRKFLRAEFDALLDNFRGAVFAMIAAYVISTALTMVVSLVLSGVDNPNQQTIQDFAMSDYNAIFAAAVFLAPLVEETLFRGLIFGVIRKKNRAAAYIISVLVFSVYHVWQYLVFLRDPTVLISAVQYVPLSIAFAYCYERSGSLWAPVFLHMLNNLALMLVIKYYYGI